MSTHQILRNRAVCRLHQHQHHPSNHHKHPSTLHYAELQSDLMFPPPDELFLLQLHTKGTIILQPNQLSMSIVLFLIKPTTT